MGRLIYSVITSLDGFIADERGKFDWAAPDEQVHAFVNDLERSVGTYLYGRGMYETMVYWQTAPDGRSTVTDDYAQIWRSAEKIVYSRTLTEVSSERTRLEREFDAAAVRDLKARQDVTVGGPTLAAHALRAGLVDEVQLLLAPVIVGGGPAALPAGLRLDLELTDERRFDNGTVHLRYRVQN